MDDLWCLRYDGLSVAEIAKRYQVSEFIVHRALFALPERGYIEQLRRATAEAIRQKKKVLGPSRWRQAFGPEIPELVVRGKNEEQLKSMYVLVTTSEDGWNEVVEAADDSMATYYSLRKLEDYRSRTKSERQSEKPNTAEDMRHAVETARIALGMPPLPDASKYKDFKV